MQSRFLAFGWRVSASLLMVLATTPAQAQAQNNGILSSMFSLAHESRSPLTKSTHLSYGEPMPQRPQANSFETGRYLEHVKFDLAPGPMPKTFSPDIFKFEVEPREICADPTNSHFNGLKVDLQLRQAFCDDIAAAPAQLKQEFYIARDPLFMQASQYPDSQMMPDAVSLTQALRIHQPDEDKLGSSTIGSEYNSLSAVMVFLFGAVLMTPENLGGWPQARKDQIDQGIGFAWNKNIREGLVMDKDAAYVNYVLHPYSGAAYYMIARKGGMSALAAFGFSFLMSVQWELLETIGEPLSIQDLIATPIVGALMGELFYRVYEAVHARPEFAESFLGKLTLAIVDPIGTVTSATDHLAKKIWHPKATGHVEMFLGGPTGGGFGSGFSSPGSARSSWTQFDTIGGRIRFSF